ncbi:MAG: tRNA lysidine(34) synthetase TilS, partial [Ferruginibacter sp.]
KRLKIKILSTKLNTNKLRFSAIGGPGDSLLSTFKQYIKTQNLFQPKEHLLLAVSGGVDSVVLCELCQQAGFNFSIAHCNFQLRGEESNGDEKFVKDLAAHYNVPFFVKQFDTEKYAAENKISIQVAARELRYSWFTSIIDSSKSGDDSNKTGGDSNKMTDVRKNAPINHQQSTINDSPAINHQLSTINFLLTAHHTDDNIETILMNFFKGSGINGLKGILPKQKNIVRPLLFAGKEDILTFANENNLAYREDSSNNSDKYTRNYFRHQLIPGIEKIFPKVKENLADNAERFREINMLYNISVATAKKKLITISGNEVHLPVLKLEKTTALHSVLYEIIKEFGFTSPQVKEVIKLLHSESGKYVQSQTHRILRNRKWLIISPLNTNEADNIILEKNDNEIIFPGGKLRIERKDQPGKIEANPNSVQIDASQIKFPLLLRKWKKGDYFYPLGMQRKKKLSRFFVDTKLSLNQKQKTWVIESRKKIIWIVGQRIDDRFKITNHSKDCLKLTLE